MGLAALAATPGWRLIAAALPAPARPEADAGGDEGGAPAGAASRRGAPAPILRSFLKVLLVTTAVMAALSRVGPDVAPLLASAGVIGVAIGFGAQSLMRDVFAGLFFLIDDAFRVGEHIEIDEERRGQVDAI